MEERKLVDIEEVKDVLGDTINSEGDYRHALRLLNGLSSFTEQDIVKPYLEKLKEQVSHCNLCLLVNKEDVLGFIDNLLSESEGQDAISN